MRELPQQGQLMHPNPSPHIITIFFLVVRNFQVDSLSNFQLNGSLRSTAPPFIVLQYTHTLEALRRSAADNLI